MKCSKHIGLVLISCIPLPLFQGMRKADRILIMGRFIENSYSIVTFISYAKRPDSLLWCSIFHERQRIALIIMTKHNDFYVGFIVLYLTIGC